MSVNRDACPFLFRLSYFVLRCACSIAGFRIICRWLAILSDPRIVLKVRLAKPALTVVTSKPSGKITILGWYIGWSASRLE